MADLYTIWANKKGDIDDEDWVNGMRSFFDHLISEGKMESYRITRCKMGFRSIPDLPEWMIIMEFQNMAQMDEAFRRVAPRYVANSKRNTDHSISSLVTISNTHYFVIGPISSNSIN